MRQDKFNQFDLSALRESLKYADDLSEVSDENLYKYLESNSNAQSLVEFANTPFDSETREAYIRSMLCCAFRGGIRYAELAKETVKEEPPQRGSASRVVDISTAHARTVRSLPVLAAAMVAVVAIGVLLLLVDQSIWRMGGASAVLGMFTIAVGKLCTWWAGAASPEPAAEIAE